MCTQTISLVQFIFLLKKSKQTLKNKGRESDRSNIFLKNMYFLYYQGKSAKN